MYHMVSLGRSHEMSVLSDAIEAHLCPEPATQLVRENSSCTFLVMLVRVSQKCCSSFWLNRRYRVRSVKHTQLVRMSFVICEKVYCSLPGLAIFSQSASQLFWSQRPETTFFQGSVGSYHPRLRRKAVISG